MTLDVDVVIFGGGGAGLWLLEALSRRGHLALLLESGDLGGGQTGCAQGIIHGGLKYTLDGVLSRAAAAVRGMPDLWRECLAGRGTPDLRATRVRADVCHLWRTAGMRSRLGMIGARVGLRVAPQPVPTGERPAALAECPGTVARLAEPVIDPLSLVADLARGNPQAIRAIEPTVRFETKEGRVRSIAVAPRGGGGRTVEIRPRAVILAAGAGNASLRSATGREDLPAQQRRPLHMLMVRGAALPPLNGHCLDAARTRVTVTSDSDDQGRVVWQVGGQVAEAGVAMDQEAFLRFGAAELRAVLPGVDLAGAQWAAYRIDRAEPASAGRRPGDVGVFAAGNVIEVWPTKLALLPRLVEPVTACLPAGAAARSPALPPLDWPAPRVAQPPWERAQEWSTGL